MDLKIFSDKAPSDLIESLVTSGGSPVQECDACGRIHFDQNGECMDEGELESWETKAKAEPEKYCSQDGTVIWGFASGKNLVIGCPCNYLTILEQTFWGNKRLISRYLVARSKSALEKAKDDARIAEETKIVEEV